MRRDVFALRGEGRNVLRSVVISNVIDVMDDFARIQRTSKLGFGDQQPSPDPSIFVGSRMIPLAHEDVTGTTLFIERFPSIGQDTNRLNALVVTGKKTIPAQVAAISLDGQSASTSTSGTIGHGLSHAADSTLQSLSRQWTSFVERGNEPHYNGRALSYATGINTHGILTSNGLDPSCGDELFMADYGTTHLPRDMDHFPRDSKDLFELRERSGKPWVSDEPLGIADYDQQGSGARTTDRSAVASHFGLAMMFGAGATIHSTFGLEGRVPYASEPISQALAETITRIWQCVPVEAQLGAYRAPHLSGFPVDCPGASCSELEHAYATVLDDRAWLVVPRPVIGWTPVGVDGWQVDSSCDDLPIWELTR